MLYHFTQTIDYYKNNSVKTLGKKLQCTGLLFLSNLCSLLTFMACEHCLASGAPNCDCAPSLTPSELVRRTEEEVNRNPTIDFSYITVMPVVHRVQNFTLYALSLYINYMSSVG